MISLSKNCIFAILQASVSVFFDNKTHVNVIRLVLRYFVAET